MLLHSEIGTIVGRDKLLTEIFTEIKKGKHILLTGSIGIGKSTMLEALHHATNSSNTKSIFIPQTNPMKPCLEDIVEALHRHGDLLLGDYENANFKADMPWPKLRRSVRRMIIKDLSSIIIRSLHARSRKGTPHKKYIVFLDHLERITPTQEAFFSSISHHAAVVGATDEKKPSRYLKRIWWMFKDVEVPALSDDEIKDIAAMFVDTSGLLIEDRQLFLTTIAKESKGNPLACANMLTEYQGEKVIKRSHMRQFHAEAGTRQVDITPIFLLAFAVGIAARFFALGLNDATLYVLAGFTYAAFYFLRFFFYKAVRGER